MIWPTQLEGNFTGSVLRLPLTLFNISVQFAFSGLSIAISFVRMQAQHSFRFQANLWLIVLCLVVVGAVRSEENSNTVVDRLAKVELFAFGGVGFVGVTSPGEKDYRLLLSSPSAEADFEKVFASGNLQAKCYALVGIRRLNPERFKTLSASLRSSQAKVSTMHGCTMFRRTAADLVELIETGYYSKY
jgi:hypothetical protein